MVFKTSIESCNVDFKPLTQFDTNKSHLLFGTKLFVDEQSIPYEFAGMSAGRFGVDGFRRL